jgi:hypothetical protein
MHLFALALYFTEANGQGHAPLDWLAVGYREKESVLWFLND